MNIGDTRSSGSDRSAAFRPWVIGSRLLLLLAAAGALVSGVVHARAHDRAALVASERYVCPMHPQIESATPGDCPICHMALVPGRAAEVRSSAMPTAPPVEGTAAIRIVAHAVKAAAWVGDNGEGATLLYRDDLVGLSDEEPARFFGGASPNMPLAARLLTRERTPVDASMVRVAFRLGHLGELVTDRRGLLAVGSLQLDARARPLLVVPTSAVVYSARGPYVLVAGGTGEPTKRPVEVGRNLDSGYVGSLAGRQEGATAILSGLREGEKVVAGRLFFVDAERRLRAERGTSEGATR